MVYVLRRGDKSISAQAVSAIFDRSKLLKATSCETDGRNPAGLIGKSGSGRKDDVGKVLFLTTCTIRLLKLPALFKAQVAEVVWRSTTTTTTNVLALQFLANSATRACNYPREISRKRIFETRKLVGVPPSPRCGSPPAAPVPPTYK